jgi:Ca2+:H+ antiporter
VLVIPFCVVLAWMMGEPLDLNFNAFEACVYFLAVLLACITVMVRV